MTEAALLSSISSAVTVKGATKIVGVFGDPIAHTLSPKMHNFAFAQLNLDFIYLPFLVHRENLKSAVESIRNLNLAGVNVTIPHKEAILPYLDELTPLAQAIGAVNTVWNRRGKLIGHNTDSPGFLTSLKEDGKFDPRNKRAVILGSGGTARAISAALLESGIKKLVIVNRTFERGQTLVSQLKKFSQQPEIYAAKLSAEILREELRNSDLFLNATPTGMDTTALAFQAEKFLSPHLFVFDALYAKATPLLLAAQRAGAAYLGGLGMLIRQGALSFSLWTGVEPPVNFMRQSLENK